MPLGLRRRRSHRPPTLTVDEPTAAVDLTTGTLLVRGWAIDRSGGDPGTVVVTVDHQQFPTRRLVRPDVSEHLDLDPELEVGFTAALDRRSLPASGTVSVRADFATGRSIEAQSVPFTNQLSEPVPVEPLDVCPICASADRAIVGSSDGLRMARCAECTVVYTVDRPEAGFLAARYSSDYFTNEYLPALEVEREAMVEHWKLLLDMLDAHKGLETSLFEIGAGAGEFLVAARHRGWQVSGIDINDAAVAHGQRAHGLELRCLPADAEPVSDQLHDAVVSEMSLEHVVDPVGVVARAAAVLRPGGVLMIFTVCADGTSFGSLGMASPLVGPAEHLFLFTAPSLRRLVESAGLEPLHHWSDEAGDAIGLIARRPA